MFLMYLHHFQHLLKRNQNSNYFSTRWDFNAPSSNHWTILLSCRWSCIFKKISKHKNIRKKNKKCLDKGIKNASSTDAAWFKEPSSSTRYSSSDKTSSLHLLSQDNHTKRPTIIFVRNRGSRTPKGWWMNTHLFESKCLAFIAFTWLHK